PRGRCSTPSLSPPPRRARPFRGGDPVTSTTMPIGRRKGRAQTTAREVPPPIQWHEGMLLAPQHFQQLSLRHELLVHYHAAQVSPFHWGVRYLEIDPVPLTDGILRVLDLEAVMPDGLAVSHAAS